MAKAKIKYAAEVYEEFYEEVTRQITKRLERHWQDHFTGLSFRVIMPHFAMGVNKLGITLNDLLDTLEERGVVRIVSTSNGKRTIFPGSVDRSIDDLQEQLEREAEAQKKKTMLYRAQIKARLEE